MNLNYEINKHFRSGQADTIESDSVGPAAAAVFINLFATHPAKLNAISGHCCVHIICDVKKRWVPQATSRLSDAMMV